MHEVDVAFPADLLSGASQTPIPFLDTFRNEQAVRDQSDVAAESTLSEVDTQEDISRWIITAVAFGLPAIFWTIVVIGLVRRLRERRRVVGDVPHHLADPPTASDPAIVAVLDGEGTPVRRAVGVMIVGYIISFISGYTLTNRGWHERALWRSFARYIDDQSEIKKAVGPAGIVMWGPYLAYGAVLGEATHAARPLTP